MKTYHHNITGPTYQVLSCHGAKRRRKWGDEYVNRRILPQARLVAFAVISLYWGKAVMRAAKTLRAREICGRGKWCNSPPPCHAFIVKCNMAKWYLTISFTFSNNDFSQLVSSLCRHASFSKIELREYKALTKSWNRYFIMFPHASLFFIDGNGSNMLGG